MQALMLAAGMGTRLGKYTEAMAKCMIEVGDKSLIAHAAEALRLAGIKKLIVVVGWEGEKLIRFIQQNISGIEFEFIRNDEYASTNNIYSLYLAREQLCQDDTILLESDLIFDKTLIRRMVDHPEKDLVAVAKYEHWMDGTVTTIGSDGAIKSFIDKKHFRFSDAGQYYKTVNIYKFSRDFCENQYIPFLDAYIRAYGRNQYYEAVLGALVHLDDTRLKSFVLENENWYEVDDAQDLDIANTLFADDSEKLARYEIHYGGNWRFPRLSDHCNPSNPYFPPQKMKDQIKYLFDDLLTQCPSGMNIHRLLAGKIFSAEPDRLLVGNDVRDLLDILGQNLSGKLAASVPQFSGSLKCFRNCEIISVNAASLISEAQNADITAFSITDEFGGALGYDDVIRVLDVCRKNGTKCIIDETYADYADSEKRFELISDKLLEAYPELIVIKDLGCSFGVHGLRMAVLASSNKELMSRLESDLPIWNLDSFAEYFLQIYSLYKKDFRASCDKTAAQRRLLMESLADIPYLEPYPSQTSAIVCRITDGRTSRELASELLYAHRILIGEMDTDQNHIRIAVRNEAENQRLIAALRAAI